MAFLLMEPKSIAFYTAVAVSILAVLSATTFPTLAQAQTTPAEETEQPEEETNDNESTARNSEPQGDDSTEEDSDDSDEEGAAANSNNRASQSRLGLDSSNGLVSCGQIVSGEVELTNDLNCNSGDGLIVGAPGTHINLNGYKITASDDAGSQGLSMDYDGSSGILVANADGVIISGLGEISGFDRGVTFMGSSD